MNWKKLMYQIGKKLLIWGMNKVYNYIDKNLGLRLNFTGADHESKI